MSDEGKSAELEKDKEDGSIDWMFCIWFVFFGYDFLPSFDTRSFLYQFFDLSGGSVNCHFIFHFIQV